MMKKSSFIFTLPLVAFLLLSGCATPKGESASLYDFGPLPDKPANAQASATVPPPIAVAEVNASAWLDSQMMFFRLSYANDQQPRPYANSRWLTPPAQLFAQRFKARIAQAGGVAISATDGAVNVPLLRIEADDFMQVFELPERSAALVSMRAAVFDGRSLVAQKSFTRRVPSVTADANGGARALASASDAIITDMMTWLTGLRLNR